MSDTSPIDLAAEVVRLRDINAKLVESHNSLLLMTSRQEDEIARLRAAVSMKEGEIITLQSRIEDLESDAMELSWSIDQFEGLDP